MPRRARLLIPGGLFHVIARGNERRKIFLDASDYSEFLDRLEIGLEKSKCRCLAWVLMPNHFHLLIQSGPQGSAAPLMRRLMTGYVGHFNRRYRRSGHLFQNRYKSILCDRDSYLTELVRYIHLNPMRAGIVKTLEELKLFPWSGHGTIMNHKPRKWQVVDEVLLCFGSNHRESQKRYEAFVREGLHQGKREDLIGGGLLRSLGRKPGQWGGLQRDDKIAYDDRILGSGHFVESVLKEAEKESLEKTTLSIHEIAEMVAGEMNVDLKDLLRKGRRDPVSKAKAVLIFLGTRLKGLSCKSMAEMTGMSIQAASMAKERGSFLLESIPVLSKLII
ncbi:MAG: transposase [Elusimicrobia bacterium]|nr:transposase [Elusimicrobiota bacterium]